MADGKTETEQRQARESSVASEAAPRRVEALADMVNAATALQEIQAAAAIEAARLPEKRLDDAGPDGGAKPYTLRIIGQKSDGTPETQRVNADGVEVNESGKPAGARE
jgi:hypothetical protein